MPMKAYDAALMDSGNDLGRRYITDFPRVEAFYASDYRRIEYLAGLANRLINRTWKPRFDRALTAQLLRDYSAAHNAPQAVLDSVDKLKQPQSICVLTGQQAGLGGGPETPGHTPESISILVIDTAASPEPKMVLTGDTLFIGDVGRPDLVGIRGLTPEHMAGLLYDSLHGKILTLPDAVEVYPAHGAGSLCGKNISKDTWSTIGEQRRTNHALQPMSREAFVHKITADLP
jgi:glyoxylase-like metal-dependent hydrolase (beta-lactamase superfamily II)